MARTLAALAILATPAFAQTGTGAAAALAAATAFASRTGALLYALDRAAWVATDAATASVPRGSLTGPGGYVVEPEAAGALLVTFFRGEGAESRAFFQAVVRDGKVAERRPLPTPVPLTAGQSALAAARGMAAAEAVKRGYRPCTAAPFNTVVIPPATPGGPIGVYLLSAHLKTNSFPAGGHYRVVLQDGVVQAVRPFSRSCLDLTVPKLPAGATPVGLFVNHLLDPTPTEIHVFTSYTARMPLFVGTPGGRVWSVTGARIAPSAMKPPAPPRS